MRTKVDWTKHRLVVASRTSHVPLDISFELLEAFIRENIPTNISLLEYLLRYCTVTRSYKALYNFQKLEEKLIKSLERNLDPEDRELFEDSLVAIQKTTIPDLVKIVKFVLDDFDREEMRLMGIRHKPIGWEMLSFSPRYPRATLNMLIRDLEEKLQEEVYTRFVARNKG